MTTKIAAAAIREADRRTAAPATTMNRMKKMNRTTTQNTTN